MLVHFLPNSQNIYDNNFLIFQELHLLVGLPKLEVKFLLSIVLSFNLFLIVEVVFGNITANS